MNEDPATDNQPPGPDYFDAEAWVEDEIRRILDRCERHGYSRDEAMTLIEEVLDNE